MPTKDAHLIRVRFAPSPTGPFHLGSARTALFNWLFAKQNNGQFILRIEDTDKERSDKNYENQIYDSLKWLKINWDEGPDNGGKYEPYRQSERTKIYRKYLEKLIEENKAYYCYCTKEELEAERQAKIVAGLQPKYNGHCHNLESPPSGKKPQLIRFRTPETKIEFKDLIRNKVSFDTSPFGDIIIAKDLENPLYNFAVVVDDEEMKISHVIRGEDHISNTPKQILFQKALEFREPIYAHLPLILSANRSKLSKRYAETSLLKYRDEGYLPEAIVNFLVFLGWHPKDEREIFDMETLIKEFDIKRVQKAGAIWNEEKLLWLNSQHIRKIESSDIADILKPILEARNIKANRNFIIRVVDVEKERVKNINEFIDLAGFFFELPDYEPKLLVWKKSTFDDTKQTLEKSIDIFTDLDESEFKKDKIFNIISSLSDDGDRGGVFWPIRVAVSGEIASPDPTAIIETLGKEETLRRLKMALNKLTGLNLV
jgi:nondiscriminating glutamyl-tRNA synthetase